MKTKYSYKIDRSSIHSIIDNVVFLDIETTGLNPSENEIIEVGAIKISHNSIEVFETLVKPNKIVPSQIFSLCQDLTIEELNKAPTWDEVKVELLNFIKDETIICHNSNFEISFFEQYLYTFKDKRNVFLDSMELAMILKPNLKYFNLDYLIKELLKSDKKERHRGVSDSLDTINIVNKLIDDAKKEDIYTLKNVENLLVDWDWHNYIINASILIDFNNSKIKNKSKKNKNITKNVDLQLYEELLKQEELWKTQTNEYSFREPQYEMSKMVKQCLIDNKVGVIQSDTGTGKSIAYSLPSAIYSFYKNEKIFISTQTKALQTQLIEKDIPHVLESLNLYDSIKILQLKGKSNYICKLMLNDFQKNISIKSLSLQERLAITFIKNLIESGKYGDIEEIAYSAKMHLNLDMYLDLFKINENFNCNKKCKFKKTCFYKNQIRKLKESNIVVINHSLLLMWPYEYEYGKIEKVIVDEAHNLPDTIRDVYSIEVNNIQINNKIEYLLNIKGTNSIYPKGLLNSIKGIDFKLHKENIEQLNKETTILIRKLNEKLKNKGNIYNNKIECYMEKSLRREIEVDLNRYSKTLEIVYKSLSNNIVFIKNNYIEYYNSLDESFIELIRDKIKELIQIKMNIDNFLKATDSRYSCSIIVNEIDNFFVIKAEPLNISNLYYNTFLKEIKSCIFTSATLTLDRNLNNFKGNLGINRLDEKKLLQDKILTNIYDYNNNTIIAVPNDTPKFFKDKEFQTPEAISYYVANFVIKLLNKINGNILILTTSKKRLELIKEYIYGNTYNLDIEIIANKKDIYKLKDNNSNKRFIIIGSKSFFEGVDIPGDDLNCVVLEKIPNLVPTSPLVQAFKNNNIDYNEINKPQIEILLKQAFGRLIRSEFDYGYFFVLNGITNNNKYLLYKIKNKNIVIDSSQNILSNINANYEKWEIQSIKSVLEYIDSKYSSFSIKNIYDLCEIINSIFLKRNIKCKVEIKINKNNNDIIFCYLYRNKFIQNNEIDKLTKSILLKMKKD